MSEVILVRHAETEWSRAGRHTGRSDIPLTEDGRAAASALAPRLADRHFALALTSPLSRASDTADLAGLDAVTEADLLEWDYGEYEGLTTPQIRAGRPAWSLWRDGCPAGEDVAAVGERVDRVIAQIQALIASEAGADAAIVAHGHVLRVLAARWCELDPAAGARLRLDTGTVSLLGWERETPVIWRWNAT
jgi:broad specificity phosphatase PhoE